MVTRAQSAAHNSKETLPDGHHEVDTNDVWEYVKYTRGIETTAAPMETLLLEVLYVQKCGPLL